MMVIDNSPIDEPAIGRLVNEQYAVGQLADCCLYALPSNTNDLAEEGKKVFDDLMKTMGKRKLLNHYDYEVLEKMPVLDRHPKLDSAIKEEHCQFVMPLYTPSKADKQYLLLKTEQQKLFSDIAMMIYTSERITRHSMEELLMDFAVDTPEAFCESIKEAVKSEKFWKNYLASLVGGMFNTTFGMAASLPNIREILKIDGIITHQKKSAMLDRLMENITQYRKKKDKKAEAELNYVLSSLDIESLKHVLTKMSKRQMEYFCKAANPKILAQESTMTMEIRNVGKINPASRADGKYRLFLHKDYDQIQVHFDLRDAFIIYLIYLIDKHEREEVDTLKIESYKSQFMNLYEAVYEKDDAGKRFDRLIKRIDDEGKPRQAQIKHCYSDIRIALGNGCEKLGELPSPYILTDAKDHLYVLKDKISIPQRLIDIAKGK